MKIYYKKKKNKHNIFRFAETMQTPFKALYLFQFASFLPITTGDNYCCYTLLFRVSNSNGFKIYKFVLISTIKSNTWGSSLSICKKQNNKIILAILARFICNFNLGKSL